MRVAERGAGVNQEGERAFCDEFTHSVLAESGDFIAALQNG
jgi:hypothetical protein